MKTIHHIYQLGMAACAFSLALVSCSDDRDFGQTGDEVQLINAITIAPTDYELPDGTICLEFGQTLQLSYAVSPDSASNPNVKWSTSNENIVTASQTGLLTAGQTEGSAVVYVKPEIGFGPSAATPTVKVKVVEQTIPIESLTLSTGNAEDGLLSTTVLAGETRQMTVTALPADHTFSNYTWTSSNESVATVDNEGFVTTLAEGSAIITATSRDKGGATASYSFTVLPSVMPTAVEFVNTDDLQHLAYGETINLKDYVRLTPENATFSLLQWTSDNESVASVDKKGNLNIGLTFTSSLFKLEGHNVKLNACDASGKIIGTVELSTDGGRFIHNFKNGLAPFNIKKNDGASYSVVDGHLHVELGYQSATDSRQDIAIANTSGFLISTTKYKYFAIKMRRPYYYDATTGTYSRRVPGKSGNKLALNLTPTSVSNVGHWEGQRQLDLATCSFVNETWTGEPNIYVWQFDTVARLVEGTDAASGLVDIRNADIVVADVKAEQEKSYDIYWAGTFSSLEEIKAYAEANQ